MNINWYPGHMHKTKNIIIDHLKMVDIVYELLDARIPYSSSNPVIDEIISNKKRITILNKKDKADDQSTQKWINWYRKKGITAVPFDSISGNGVVKLLEETRTQMFEGNQHAKSRGIKNRSIKVMILGIPNVGKSTLINRISASSKAKTGNKPGVTKGKQWIRTDNEILFLDTPGILWPKFSEIKVSINLALTGSIKDELLDLNELSLELINILLKMYPDVLTTRYDLEEIRDNAHDILEDIGRKKGCLISGGNVDLERTARLVINDFRNSKLGRISLETPETIEENI